MITCVARISRHIVLTDNHGRIAIIDAVLWDSKKRSDDEYCLEHYQGIILEPLEASALGVVLTKVGDK
jgi:hypothetical protein